jgi:hypothetical protein
MTQVTAINRWDAVAAFRNCYRRWADHDRERQVFTHNRGFAAAPRGGRGSLIVVSVGTGWDELAAVLRHHFAQ